MLSTLSAVKARLGIPDLTVEFDDLLTTALTALSARFDKETNCTLSRTVNSTHEFDAIETEIIPRCYPIPPNSLIEIHKSAFINLCNHSPFQKSTVHAVLHSLCPICTVRPKMPARAIIFACVLPLLGAAQEIPYTAAKWVQDSMKEFRRIDGVTAEATIEHSNPADARSFRVFLETPRGRSEIKVRKDGSFRLPPVAKEDQDRSRLVGSLEKDALALSFTFDIESKPVAFTNDVSLFAVCWPMVEKFKETGHVWDALVEVIPDAKGFQLAIVGISFPRQKPASGRVLLKNGEKTVASIDLSQTGTACWMFDEYDPKANRIVWEMKNGERRPRAYLVYKCGEEAERVPGAMFLIKAQPDGPANGSQPIREGTNRTPPAAGSRR